ADEVQSDKWTGPTDVWVHETSTGAASKLTFGPSANSLPIWSADGKKIFFSSNRTGNFNLYSKDATGNGKEEVILKSENWLWANDCSRDGRFLLYEEVNPKTDYDLWALSLSDQKPPIPLVNMSGKQAHGRFSPDGQYVVYASEETGRYEIYVQAFPDASRGKWQISTAGGFRPLWSRDGKEIFYLTPDRQLISADTSHGFPIVSSKVLFTNVPVRTMNQVVENLYAVSPDGQRFLVDTPLEDPTRASITIISNWQQLLKK
ncbi:MAG: hypothetical protein C5B54_12045, partial [Acidobacteria bacterium]